MIISDWLKPPIQFLCAMLCLTLSLSSCAANGMNSDDATTESIKKWKPLSRVLI